MSHAVSSLFFNVPFDRHRVVETSDVDEARIRTGRVLNPHRLRLTQSGQTLRNRLDVLACGRLSLLRLAWGADVSVDPGSLDTYYLLVLPVQGSAVFHFDGRSLEVSSRVAAIVSPGRRFHLTASPDYEQILLRLDAQAIQASWCRLTAQDSAPSICFDAIMPLHAAGWQALLPMLHWVARCSALGSGHGPGDMAVLEHTEMLVATTLLLHQPHSMAARLWPVPPPAAPVAVRRAQAFMREHLGEPMPVTRVAVHCGLSVRRLQALFQDECGQSPMRWLRQQRLQAVREALLAQGSVDKVSDLALRFGFVHLGEFSRAYRQAFGETPQQTRGKGVVRGRA